jgi:tRNA(Ile)-lysidine synthase
MRVMSGFEVGAEMQLAGGVEVLVGRDEIVLRPRRSRSPAAAGSDYMVEVPLADGVEVGPWRLREGEHGAAGGACVAWLPTDRPLTVRAWRAGDRMRVGRAARRVKRFFADARVPGRDRPGWPVVLAGGEIVWIPGVRRSDAATDRPGRPGVHYLCERIDG